MSSYLTAEEFSAFMTDETTEQPQVAQRPHLVAVEPEPVAAAKPEPVVKPIALTQLPPRPAATVAVATGACRTEPAHDPTAKPNTGLNLRLNDYQLELIRELAAREERSMQQVIRRTLIPAIEEALSCED
jgi:hypothetical protein